MKSKNATISTILLLLLALTAIAKNNTEMLIVSTLLGLVFIIYNIVIYLNKKYKYIVFVESNCGWQKHKFVDENEALRFIDIMCLNNRATRLEIRK